MGGHLPSAGEGLRRRLLTWVPELVNCRAPSAGAHRPLVNVAICLRHRR